MGGWVGGWVGFGYRLVGFWCMLLCLRMGDVDMGVVIYEWVLDGSYSGYTQVYVFLERFIWLYIKIGMVLWAVRLF